MNSRSDLPAHPITCRCASRELGETVFAKALGPMRTPLTMTAACTAAGAPPRLSRFAQWADRHFKWLLVAPAVLLILALSIYPLLFSLVVSFINYDFQVPGPRLRRPEEFRAGRVRSGGALVAGADGVLSGVSVAIEFVLGLAGRADHGAQLSGPRR